MTQTKEERILVVYRRLVVCARKRKTATYTEIGDEINVGANRVWLYLDPINDKTDEKHCVLLSVLVVSSITHRPSETGKASDFYHKAKSRWKKKSIDPKSAKSRKNFFCAEREKVFLVANDFGDNLE